MEYMETLANDGDDLANASSYAGFDHFDKESSCYDKDCFPNVVIIFYTFDISNGL